VHLRQSCRGELGVPIELMSLPVGSLRRAMQLVEGR